MGNMAAKPARGQDDYRTRVITRWFMAGILAVGSIILISVFAAKAAGGGKHSHTHHMYLAVSTLCGLLVIFLTAVILHRNWPRMTFGEKALEGLLTALGLFESVGSLYLLF